MILKLGGWFAIFSKSILVRFVSVLSGGGACWTTVVEPPFFILSNNPGAAAKSSFGDNSNKPPSLVETWVLPSAGDLTSPALV